MRRNMAADRMLDYAGTSNNACLSEEGRKTGGKRDMGGRGGEEGARVAGRNR